MDKKYDVVVVGAGPSGSSCAHILAASGMHVALIDRHVFPRNKLCGGLLTGRSEKIFEEIFGIRWGTTIEVVSAGASFYHKDKLLNSVDNYRPLYFTSRYSFDAYLLELAEKKGAEIIQGASVSSIDDINNTVVLRKGNYIKADFIVGADGVISRVANSIFPESFDKRKLGIGLEVEVPLDDVNRGIKNPEIYFGIVRWGYGWVFPKSEKLTVGVGGVGNSNSDMKLALLKFLKQLFGRIPKLTIKGHYIPFGRYRAKPGKNNILLTGDAAGLVEPITGEGIAFAMQSAKFAAESILEAAENSDPFMAYQIYKDKYKQITTIFDKACLMRYLVFPKITEHLFLKALERSKSAIMKYMDILADEIGYSEYLLFLLRKAAKGILKTITR